MKHIGKLFLIGLSIGFVLMISFLYEDRDFPKANKTKLAFLPKNEMLPETSMPRPRGGLENDRDLAQNGENPQAQELKPFVEAATYHQFSKDTIGTPLKKIIRYQFSQNGFPIVGMEVVVEQDPSGVKTVQRQSYRKIPEVDTNQIGPALDENMRRAGIQATPESFTMSTRIIYVAPGSQEGVFAIVAPGYDPKRQKPGEFIFRASDGQILARNYARKF